VPVTIKRQEELSLRVPVDGRGGHTDHGPAHIVDARTGLRRRFDDGRALEEGSAHELLDLLPDPRKRRRIHEIDFRHDDEPAVDLEQSRDIEVLSSLRHHALVGRNTKHDAVEPGRAADHRANEILVARHIDEIDDAVLGLEIREAEHDRKPALALFLETIRFDTGQCPDECCLAVVDMTDDTECQRVIHGVEASTAPISD
jgi:hypothetical protein